MRPVILVGRPKELPGTGWIHGTQSELSWEWTQYIRDIATLSGLFLEPGAPPVDTRWVGSDMYLIPQEWTRDPNTQEFRSDEEILSLASGEGKLEERFRWVDDPTDPLRMAVKAWARYKQKVMKGVEELAKLTGVLTR